MEYNFPVGRLKIGELCLDGERAADINVASDSPVAVCRPPGSELAEPRRFASVKVAACQINLGPTSSQGDADEVRVTS